MARLAKLKKKQRLIIKMKKNLYEKNPLLLITAFFLYADNFANHKQTSHKESREGVGYIQPKR